MYLSRLAAVMVAASVLSGAAAHAGGPLRPFKIGFWSGGAYTDVRTGAFTHCSAGVAYDSGINLFVLVTSQFRWWLGFINPNWSFPPKLKAPIRLRLDSGIPFDRFATIPNRQLLLVSLPDSSHLIDAFRHSAELALDAEGQSFFFKLNQTPGVMDRLTKCVRTSIALEDEASSAPAAAASAGPQTGAGLTGRADAAVSAPAGSLPAGSLPAGSPAGPSPSGPPLATALQPSPTKAAADGSPSSSPAAARHATIAPAGAQPQPPAMAETAAAPAPASFPNPGTPAATPPAPPSSSDSPSRKMAADLSVGAFSSDIRTADGAPFTAKAAPSAKLESGSAGLPAPSAVRISTSLPTPALSTRLAAMAPSGTESLPDRAGRSATAAVADPPPVPANTAAKVVPQTAAASADQPPLAFTAVTPELAAPSALPMGPEPASATTVEEVRLATDFLARAQMPDAHLIGADKPPALADFAAVWRSEDAAGAVKIIPPGPDISAVGIASNLIAVDPQMCKGDFAAARFRIDIDDRAVFSAVLSCSETNQRRITEYFIAPRRQGGFVVFAVIRSKGVGEIPDFDRRKLDGLSRAAIQAVESQG
ncbi:MAG TPA: hypothetical protein VL985_17500 [Stellaceae bacterium]|nr:hypothetical protein [Stellaceae bacterium]